MFTFMMITKALSDENRVRTLLALDGRELCVCQIIELLGLAPSMPDWLKAARTAVGDITVWPALKHQMRYKKPLPGPSDHFRKHQGSSRMPSV